VLIVPFGTALGVDCFEGLRLVAGKFHTVLTLVDKNEKPHLVVGGAVATGHEDAIRLAETQTGGPIILKLSGEMGVGDDATVNQVNETSGTAHKLMTEGEPDRGHENDVNNFVQMVPDELQSPDILLFRHPTRDGRSIEEAKKVEHLDTSLISRHDASNDLNVVGQTLDHHVRALNERKAMADSPASVEETIDYPKLLTEIFPEDGSVRVDLILKHAKDISALRIPSAEGMLLKLEMAEMDSDGNPKLGDMDKRRFVVILKPDMERAIAKKVEEQVAEEAKDDVADSTRMLNNTTRNIQGLIHLSKGLENDGLLTAKRQDEIEAALKSFQPGDLESAILLRKDITEMTDLLQGVEPEDHIQIIPLPQKPEQRPPALRRAG